MYKGIVGRQKTRPGKECPGFRFDGVFFPGNYLAFSIRSEQENWIGARRFSGLAASKTYVCFLGGRTSITGLFNVSFTHFSKPFMTTIAFPILARLPFLNVN